MTWNVLIEILLNWSSHSSLDKTILLKAPCHLKRLWPAGGTHNGFIYGVVLWESVHAIDDGTVEYVVNTFIVFSRCFVDSSQIKPLSQLNCLIELNLPLIRRVKVRLVAHQDDVASHFLGAIRYEVLNLLLYQIEACSVRDVINCDAPMWVSVVSLGNRAKSLLACRVPDLHLDDFVINGQSLNFKIDSDSAEITIIVQVLWKPD